MPMIQQALIRAANRIAPQYLTGLDLRVGHPSSPCLLVYPQGLDGMALQHSLAKVLHHYPVMTGRMKTDAQGHIYIGNDDTGITFTEQRHDLALPAYGPDKPMGADIARYHRRILPWRVVDNPGQPLMAIELHHFACGGAILSVMGTHTLFDGGAFWTFMQDWLRTHHGHPISPPALERQPLIDVCEAHMHRPYTQGFVRHYGAWQRAGMLARMGWAKLTDMDTLSFRVTPAQIEAWREQARAQGDEADGLPSAQDFVIAHCVRHLSARLPAQHMRHIGQVCDLRFRRIPGIARKYIGNAVGHDLLSLPAQALADRSLVRIARRCRMPMDRNSEDDILSYLGLMGRHRLSHSNVAVWVQGIAHCLQAGLIVNNGAHFPIYKMDFGQGPPSWFDVASAPYRMLVLLPSAKRDGGFDVRLTSRKADLAGFEPLLA